MTGVSAFHSRLRARLIRARRPAGPTLAPILGNVVVAGMPRRHLALAIFLIPELLLLVERSGAARKKRRQRESSPPHAARRCRRAEEGNH